MASPPFSAYDVYTILVNDDVPGLERAVFTLGHRIHKLIVWCESTPVLYAARLAHFEQVKILVQDLEKYGPRPLNNLWLDLWTHSLVRIKEEKDQILAIVSWLISRIPIDYFEEIMLAAVHERAFEVVEVLLKENERLIFRLVRVCIQEKRKELFQLPAWVVQNEDFTRALQQCQTPPLEPIIAMMRGDTEALQRCLDHRFASGKLDPMKIIRNAILVNDTAVTNAILDEEILKYIVSEDHMSEQEVFVMLLDGAEKGQACHVVEAVISHPRFDKSSLHWMDRYYDNILHARVTVANRIKHLVDFSDQKTKNELSESISSTEDDYDSFLYSGSISVQDFAQIIDALILLSPECDSDFLLGVKNYPSQYVRPDLVETVRERLGLDYGEREILNTKENRSHLASPSVEFRRSDTGGRLSNLRNPDEHLDAFLDPSHAVTVGPVFPGQLVLDDEDYARIERGLSETGLTLDTHSWLSLNHSDVQPCPSLRQICRIAVRKSVVDRHCAKVYRTSITDYEWKCEFGRVMDDLVSLYSDGLLPKEIVDYLLYRNGDSPFYYTLFSALL